MHSGGAANGPHNVFLWSWRPAPREHSLDVDFISVSCVAGVNNSAHQHGCQSEAGAVQLFSVHSGTPSLPMCFRGNLARHGSKPHQNHKLLTHTAVAVDVQLVSRPAGAQEGALSVGALLLTCSIQLQTLIHIWGTGRQGRFS